MIAPPLRVGLVGLGDAGRHHARALSALHHEGALVWSAIVARSAASHEAFRAAAPSLVPASTTAFESLDGVLAAAACDALILATPDGLHAAQVEAAAAAGVHVLVEKPLALGLVDGQRAASAALAARVRLQVAHHLRHHAGHALVHESLVERVGRPRHLLVRWAWPDPAVDGWRARGEGGGRWCLAALGTHGIDLAIWLLGPHIEQVAAIVAPPGGVDREAEVSLRFAGGALAHVSVAVTHRAATRVILAGERGEIECVGTLGARGGGAVRWTAPRAEPVALDYAPRDPYLSQLRDFVARARADVPTDVRDALVNLDVLDRIFGGCR